LNNEARFFGVVFNTRSIMDLKRVRMEHLSEPYQKMYEWAWECVRQQGCLPGIDAAVYYFQGLVDQTATSDAEIYAQGIWDNATRQQIESSVMDKVATPLKDGRTQEAVDGLFEAASDLRRDFRRDPGGSLLDYETNTDERLAAYELRKKARKAGVVVGMPTPFLDLTRITQGLQPGDLWAIASRPNMGKSWAAVLFATHLYQLRYRVLFVSGETPPQGNKPRDTRHQVVNNMCIRCFEKGVSDSKQCPAAEIARQRLTIRFDAVGARVSARRLLGAHLTPPEEEALRLYYQRAATPGYYGDLRITARPHVRTIDDLMAEVYQWQPHMVVWDSAYRGMKKKHKKRSDNAAELVLDIKSLAEDAGVPFLITWHFNREVREKDKDASQNYTSETDELPKVSDVVMGMFRPQKIYDAGECIWRPLKVRDSERPPGFKTMLEVAETIDFSPIPGPIEDD